MRDILPLIPLAISLAPEIGKYLFGAAGEKTASAVAQVVQSVTGTTDSAIAQQVIARDPKAAAQLRYALAKLAADAEKDARAADLDTLAARLHDTQDARAQQLGLARAGSRVQWAPAAVSFVVLVTFGIVMWAALTRALPPGSETILNMLLGTLAAMATSVVAFWVGSSSDSHRKTEMLYRSTPAPGG